MAAGPSIDVTGWLEEQLAQASPDLLRSMVQTFAEALMGAEGDAVFGADYGAGVRDGPGPGRAGGDVPHLAAGGRPLHLRGRGRVGAEGPRGGGDRQRACPASHRETPTATGRS